MSCHRLVSLERPSRLYNLPLFSTRLVVFPHLPQHSAANAWLHRRPFPFHQLLWLVKLPLSDEQEQKP